MNTSDTIACMYIQHISNMHIGPSFMDPRWFYNFLIEGRVLRVNWTTKLYMDPKGIINTIEGLFGFENKDTQHKMLKVIRMRDLKWVLKSNCMIYQFHVEACASVKANGSQSNAQLQTNFFI